MGKSDPLNVAKNINIIDNAWAKGKRPESAALSAVRLITWIVSASADDLQRFLRVLIWIYLSLGSVYAPSITRIPGHTSLFGLWNLLRTLIARAPAGGETAQVIVGALLSAEHEVYGMSSAFTGSGGSINATNTTSGKPGDFAILVDETHLHIYEVTTKKIDNQRLADSAEAIHRFLERTDMKADSLDATFLCGAEDIQVTGINEFSSVPYSGISYNFVELDGWILHTLERLGFPGRRRAIEIIAAYAEDPNTHLAVKDEWTKLASML
ncbi:MAG: hypothetical protein NTZ05_16320 [Chloroflexi bacterium]|nr:hypothetical protein [Chloroflexota bacterium]